ncbi:hypothetical protein [Polycladidibacter hongkongensis]|uniref:hypothetical protein n=1 Tax=Polycladidibacter hongkongensis TaxID=1647556 RepID=UPI00082E3D27|nr:hypothetical protein [Pseudovibrio hongkongensis]
MSDPIQALLGLKIMHLIAGLCGGLVRVIVHPRASLANTIGATVVGALVAGYLTPVVAPVLERWLGPTDAGVEGATGFMLGMCGLALSEGLIKLARRWRDDPTLPK